MTFQPGQSGNPTGRPQEKILTEALKLEAAQVIRSGKYKGMKKLRVAARRVVDRAVDGDLAAFNVLMDRFEGKPMQANETRLELGASELFLEVLRAMNRPKAIAESNRDAAEMNRDAAEMTVINAEVSPEAQSDKP